MRFYLERYYFFIFLDQHLLFATLLQIVQTSIGFPDFNGKAGIVSTSEIPYHYLEFLDTFYDEISTIKE